MFDRKNWEYEEWGALKGEQAERMRGHWQSFKLFR